MKQKGILKLIEGKQSELVNLNIPNVLFYAEDTGNYYIYSGGDKIRLNSEFTTEGFTGTFDTATETISVTNGLITGKETIEV